jgi:tryptophan-rich sensory protein
VTWGWPAFLRNPVAVAALAAIVVAGLGASATDIGPWYAALHKPSWQPPDWLFGPVWTLIYALTALAGIMAWRAAPSGRARSRILVLFAANALLNVLWSELFFHFRRPDLALMETVVFWASIIVLMAAVWPFSRPAAWVLVPYLAWVTFASVLNLVVVRLNAPFGA